MRDKVYHIYAKNKVLFHSLSETEFKQTWAQLNNMVGLMKTDYMAEDLTYEEVFTLMEDSPAGGPSY